MSRRIAGLIGLLAGVCTGAPASAEWRRLDSPNFVVVGDVSAGDLRTIAVKFEGFRETLGRIMSEQAVSTAVPTIVIVFPSDRAFTPFKPLFRGKPIEMGGVFMARRDLNYIALVSDGRADRFDIVFHEYAHLLLSNMGRRIPVWLNEGLAEFYSTFELSRGGREAVLGSPVQRHLARLNDTQLLPLDQLLTVDHQSPMYNEGDRRSIFYGQSWALAHLLLLGQPIRTPKLLAYLDSLTKGTAPMQAWQGAFAGDDIARALQAYIRQMSFRAIQYTFSSGLAKFDAPIAAMSAAEAEIVLAEFLLHQGRADDAMQRLRAAEKLDSRHPRLALAMARLDLTNKDRESAARRVPPLETPADWLVGYLAAVGVADLADGTGRPDAAQLESARRFFAAARAGRPEFPNALARMTQLELRSADGPTADTRAAIERARTQAPGRHEYTLLYAQVLARQSEFVAARAALGPLLSSAYPANVRESAKSLMSYVVQLEEARTRPTSPRARGAGVTTPPAPPASDVTVANHPPSEPVRKPVFRVLRTGETRAEGMLERIDCVSGTGIVFRVKTTDGVVTATAAQFSDIDFITYRDDLRGNVECGPLKEPMSVYLTWRPGTAGAKLVVAIEFLPKNNY
jgi:hypothetical protein